MSSEISSASNGSFVSINLPSKLDTATATHLHAELLANIDNDVSLNGSSVEHVGGRCLDVLLAAQKAWGRSGKKLILEQPSAQMLNDLSILGCSPESLTTGDAL